MSYLFKSLPTVKRALAAAMVLAMTLLMVSPAYATTYYWNGTGADRNRWEGASNWSTTDGGFSGGAVPTSTDIAIFRGGGGVTPIIRSNVQVLGIVLDAAWTGSVLQGSGRVMVGGSGIRIGAGTWNGGNGVLTSTGSYTQTGGTVTSLQSNFALSGSLSISGSSSKFTSTGTVLFRGNANQTFTVGTGKFANITLNNTGAAGANKVIIAGGDLNMSGALTVTQGKLDLTTNSKKASIRQSVTVGASNLANISTNSNVIMSGSLTVNNASGGLIATGGTWTFAGLGSKTLNLGGGINKFWGLTINNTGIQGDNLYTVTNPLVASGAMTLTQGILNLSTNSATLAVRSGLTVGYSTQAGIRTNSNVTVSGSLLVNNGSGGLMATAGTLTMAGNGNQILKINGSGSNKLFNVTINNLGYNNFHSVIASGASLAMSGALTVTKGKLDLSTYMLPLNVRGITVANSASGAFVTNTNVTNSGSAVVTNSSGVSSATFTVSGGTWKQISTTNVTLDFAGNKLWALTVNNTGAQGSNTATVNNPLNLSGSLTVTQGILNLSTNSALLDTRGSMTVGSSTQANVRTNSNVTVSGSLAVSNASGGLIATAGTFTLGGQNARTFNLGGGTNHLFNLLVNNAGVSTNNTITVTNPVTLSGTLTVTRGTLDLNANTVPLVVDGNATLSGTLLAGNTVVLYANWTKQTTGTFTANSSTVTLAGTSQTLSGSTTFYTLTDTPAAAATVSFLAGSTQTVTNSLTFLGSSSVTLTLNSTTSGTRWNINVPNTRTVGYVSLTDSQNTGPTVVPCPTTSSWTCTNGGNNARWAFSTTTGGSNGSGGGGGGGGGRGGGGGGGHFSPTVPTLPPTASPTARQAVQKKLTLHERMLLRRQQREALRKARHPAKPATPPKKHK